MAEDKLARLAALAESDPEAAQKLLDQLTQKNIVPHEGGQKDVLDAKERFLVLCAGRRWGKTKIGVKIALRHARREKKMVWWVAPTYRVVKRGYEELLKQLPDGVLSKPAPSSASFDSGRPVVLRFKNGTKMEFHSAERPEGMLGAAVDFVVLDEAATMPRAVWEQIIRPTLSDNSGGALFISTPRGRNWYYEIWQRGQDERFPEFKSWRFPSMTNPTIPASEWTDQEHTLPRAVYEQEILADFISNAANVFRFSDEVVLDELVKPKGHVVMGIDLAKHNDFTVLDAVNQDDRLPCFRQRFNANSWPEQKRLIREAVKNIRKAGATNVTLVIDSTGVGDPIADDLAAAGYDVVPIKFSQQWKQQAVMALSADLQQGYAFIHVDQQDEFDQYSYQITDAGRWTFSAPGGGHDDEVSAKMLQHWEVSKGGSPNLVNITTETIVETNVTDRPWDAEEEYWDDEPESELDKIVTIQLKPRTTTDLINDPSVWN